MLDLTSISVDEFLLRASVGPRKGQWSILVTEASDIVRAAEELADGVGIFLECEVTQLCSKHQLIIDLLGQVNRVGKDYVLIHQIDHWMPRDWYKFDRYIQLLANYSRGGLIILTRPSADKLARYAPVFYGSVLPRMNILNLDAEFLSEEEVELRLSALRFEKNQTDQEIIVLAQKGKLPRDPEYGEWLILLDRGDLIEKE